MWAVFFLWCWLVRSWLDKFCVVDVCTIFYSWTCISMSSSSICHKFFFSFFFHSVRYTYDGSGFYVILWSDLFAISRQIHNSSEFLLTHCSLLSSLTIASQESAWSYKNSWNNVFHMKHIGELNTQVLYTTRIQSQLSLLRYLSHYSCLFFLYWSYCYSYFLASIPIVFVVSRWDSPIFWVRDDLIFHGDCVSRFQPWDWSYSHFLHGVCL